MKSGIVLWDIDGTLLRTPGVGIRCFTDAVQSVTGREIVRQPYDFGGKTDPLIALELLAPLGIDDPAVVDAVLTEVEANYTLLAAELRRTIVILPGVSDVLDACAARGVTQTVVTGNIEPAARHKIAAGGLDAHLLLDCGGYGSDHHDRSALVRLALARIAVEHAVDGAIDPDHVWVVGDTPRDAACARDNGVHCLLVATGTYGLEELESQGADHVLTDLADVDRVVELLAG